MSGWLVVAHGSIEEAEARFQSCTAVAMLSSGHCRRTRSRRRLDAVDGDVALAREITNGYVPVLSKIDAENGLVSFFRLDNAASNPIEIDL